MTGILFIVAVAALIVAFKASNKAEAARAELSRIDAELSVLRGVVREMRRGGVAAPPDVAPEQATPPPPPPMPEPVAPQPVFLPPPEPVVVEEIPIPPYEPPIPPYVPPPPPPTPAGEPAAPRWSFDWENLVGVKLFSWIAGISLVLAAVFFLKYSVEHGWLSPTIRATMGILTGAALLVVCELRVARDYKATANALHGAGIAILYATLFAIHALWHLMPAGVVFFLMLIVTAVAVGLSIRRDSMFIALLGLMGGFATPALLSTGENRPIGLFSYLLLLNFGLAWVAYRKRWPALTLGSVAFTVLYQWGWVSEYLTPSQLPLAATVFFVFAALAAAAIWMGRRDEDDAQRIFDRVAIAAAALPLAFGIFTAAVPAYGARYNTLFGFLLLVAAGLAFIALARRQLWLHLLGGGAVLLTFAVWIGRSYTANAWPVILAWIAAFIALYLFVATRRDTEGNYAAPLLFFLLPALVIVEPRAASPALLFATFFVLLAATAYVAIRHARGTLYYIAAFFVIVAEGIWSSKHLDANHLYAALLLYGAFAILFLGVPAIARRFGRELTPRYGSSATTIASMAMLFFLTIDSVAGAALWGLALLLAILLAGTIVESSVLRRPLVAIIATLLTWLVLASWWEGIDLAQQLIGALFTVAAFGAIVLAGMIWASRGGRANEFGHAAHLALGAHLFLIFIAAQRELAFPPWALLAVLAMLTMANGTASLYLRRATLTIGAAMAGQLVLLTWTAHTLAPPWGNVALVSTLVIGAWALLWFALAKRHLHDDEAEAARFRYAPAAALLLGHIVAIGAGLSAQPPLFATLLATHVLLIVATLALAARTEMHTLAIAGVLLTALATATARTSTPSREFLFALLPYLLYIVYPLILGTRIKRSPYPHAAAVLASAVFFFFARDAMTDAGLGYMIGVLPVAQAIVLSILLLRLRRIEAPDTPDLGRLALVAAAALAFITVAIPLQLEKQWITIGWALEGAALAWLFTRIPHRGLVAWAGALLGAVFVRLAFNPAVLAYHQPGGRPILNWYLYTYAVSAAAFFAFAYWLPRAWKRSIGAACTLGTILLFLLLNIEIADFYSTGSAVTFNFLTASLAQELTYTIGWALFAIAMLVAGIALRARAARVAALLLLLVTILKCFLHDLSRLGGLYRVGSLLGLALSLVIVGVLLQKFVMVKPAATAPPEETPA